MKKIIVFLSYIVFSIFNPAYATAPPPVDVPEIGGTGAIAAIAVVLGIVAFVLERRNK